MIQVMHAAAYTIVALALLTDTGNRACRLLFRLTGMRDSIADGTSPVHPAGWIIGWLERLILAIGIITRHWDVLAAVIALKSVARFKDLDDKRFAEYFLVGSLFSILWAALITTAWLAWDHRVGMDLGAALVRMIETTGTPART